MRHFFLGLCALSSLAFGGTAEFKAASFNLQGWAGNTEARFERLRQIFSKQDLLRGVSLLMVQESIEDQVIPTAQQLAQKLGWQSISHRRVSDAEGLGFLYPPTIEVLDVNVYQIEAKHSPTDYSRMAIAMQLYDPGFGKVRVINTHLAHQTLMGATRKKQLNEIIEWASNLEAESSSNLVILGGDFNTGPAEFYYDGEFEVLGGSYFGFELVPSEGASFSWLDFKFGFRELIDHFFIANMNPNLTIRSAKTVIHAQPTSEKLSDHNFLVMTATATLFRPSQSP